MYSEEKIEEFLNAVLNNNLQKVKSMVESREIEVNLPNNEKITALHCAAYKGYEEIVKYLLSKEADIEAKTNKGITPLYSAVQHGQGNIAKILLEKKAKIDVIAGGYTIIQIAAMTDKTEIIDLLLDFGTNLNDNRGKDGTTALHTALLEGKYKVANHLLEKGVSYELCTKCGYNPLHFAARNGSEGVQLLLGHVKKKESEEGFQKYINLQDKEKGETVLHIAARTGDYHTIKYLLDNRVDFTKKDKGGKETKDYVAGLSSISQQIKKLFEKAENTFDKPLSLGV